MRNAFRVALLGAVLGSGLGAMVGCSTQSDVPIPVAALTCGWSDSVRLTPQGVGDLRNGMSAEELLRRCAVVRDTTEFTEGQAQRVVYVRVGPAVAYAEVSGDSVWRIGTRDSLLRTPDGLGVGTTVRTLLASDPAWAAHGEGSVAVGLRGHCRLSFLLAPMYSAPDRPLVVRRIADLQKAAPDTPVIRVLIVRLAPCDQQLDPARPEPNDETPSRPASYFPSIEKKYGQPARSLTASAASRDTR